MDVGNECPIVELPDNGDFCPTIEEKLDGEIKVRWKEENNDTD